MVCEGGGWGEIMSLVLRMWLEVFGCKSVANCPSRFVDLQCAADDSVTRPGLLRAWCVCVVKDTPRCDEPSKHTNIIWSIAFCTANPGPVN